MAKPMIMVLCPSGHRRKAQMTPNSNLLQVVEDMCNQENLDSSEWGLTHQRKKCDLTTPWRLLGIPTNAMLDMYKLEQPRPITDVTIQLQISDGSRLTGSFKPSTTLQEMLIWYRTQPDSALIAMDNGETSQPICAYMSEEIIGEYALANTTLRELGLTSGTAVIRYNRRSISDDELAKIKERIDNKIARRQQQTTKPSTTPVATTTSNPIPPPAPAATTYNLPRTTMDTSMPVYDKDEYSIFREAPVTRPTTNQKPTPTLAEALGLNIQFDRPPLFRPQAQPQTDFSNFKFPEATKGQDLNQLSDTSESNSASRSCDRRMIAYDLNSAPSTPEVQTEELPDSFFELTPDDLRSVLTSLRQQSSEENPLETRLLRERAQSARQNAYKNIAIRLVVNSNTILQALFYPNEPLSNLMDFVRTNLVCPQIGQSDFYLYTSPPRVVLSDLKKSLANYDLAPASYVYLGHRTVSPLVVQLASNISLETMDQAGDIVTQYVFNRSRSNDDEEITTTDDGTATRSTKRNNASNVFDDKQLRDKMRKFLPGKK